MKCPDCGGSGEISRGWMQERCSYCGGTGYVPTNVFGVNGAIKCDFCDGTGVFITNNEEPHTNEEWFCQLPTEEKAKFLFEHGVICCQFCKGDCIEIDYKTKECKYNVSPSYSYTGIVEWLKQPRTDKE